MAGGYKNRPTGAAAVAQRIRKLETDLADARRLSVNSTAHAPSWPVTVNPAAATGVPLTATPGAVALSTAVPVPEGFSAAVVMLTVSLYGSRDATTGGADTLTVQAFIGAVQADPLTLKFPTASTPGLVTQTLTATVTGLTDTLTMGALGWGSAGWVANSGVCHASALIVFLR